MIALLETIINSISALVSFVLSALHSFIIFISNIPIYLQFIFTLFGIIPDEIVAFAIFGASVSVLAMLMKHQIL